MPSERWMRVSSVRISTRSLRSRFVSGSSIRNARGSRTSARPERDALHLAARHVRRVAVHAAPRCAAAPTTRLTLRVDVGLGQLARPQRRRDVLRRRLLRVQRVALEHHRQVALGRVGLRRVDPVQQHAPVSGFSSPAITRSVVVLPAPDGPSSTKNDALGDVEFEVLQRLDVAERLRDALGHDRAVSCAHHLLRRRVVRGRRGAGVAQGHDLLLLEARGRPACARA